MSGGLALLAAAVAWCGEAGHPLRLAPAGVRQTGRPPQALAAAGRLALARQHGLEAGVILEYDLSSLRAATTPLARLHLGRVERRGSDGAVVWGAQHGVLHVVTAPAKGERMLAAALPVFPVGAVRDYTFDVTDTVGDALARHERRLRLAVQAAGKPIDEEAFLLPPEPPWLEVFPSAGWRDDWRERLDPLGSGERIYREPCLPLAEAAGAPVALRLLSPVRRVEEVVSAGGLRLVAGRDWILTSGRVVLPPGTRAPVQVAREFFSLRDPKQPGRRVQSAVRLADGGWYHERTIEITYAPADRPWSLPPPTATGGSLPRFQARLAAGEPLTVVLFGDSIAAGYNTSALFGLWPYQPGFGELVARALRARNPQLTFMNHSRPGASADHAATQADAQVAWFQPDLVILALGMNDRRPARLPLFGKNLERIIATVRARAPAAEFLLVTPTVSNPKAPGGLNAVAEVRRQMLALARRGIAVADVTGDTMALLAHKDYVDLTGNGLNHPNDFVHRIYAQRILGILAPAAHPSGRAHDGA